MANDDYQVQPIQTQAYLPGYDSYGNPIPSSGQDNSSQPGFINTPSQPANTQFQGYSALDYANPGAGSATADYQAAPETIQNMYDEQGNAPFSSGNADYPADGKSASDSSSGSSSGTASTMQSIGGIVSSAASSINQSLSNDAMASYNDKAQTAAQMNKYWFDPNNDVEPNLDQYLKQQPSATEALQKTEWIKNNTAQNVVGDLFDPGTGALRTITGNTGDTEKGKQWGYAQNQGLQGAISGYSSGGWVGAIAGTVIGVIKGYFNYGSAMDAYKKRQEEFERQYKILQEQRAARKRTEQVNLMRQNVAAFNQNKREVNANKVGAAQSKKQQLLGLIAEISQNRNPYQLNTQRA